MELNIDITTTLITAISSIIVGFLGLLAGKKEAKSLSKQEVLVEQLSNLFEPMDKLLVLSSSENADALLASLCVIVESQYRFVPPIILREIRTLKISSSLKKSDFNRLSAMVGSYYNWSRRKLGYPYDRKKIDLKFTPVTTRNEITHSVILGIYWIIYMVSILLVLVVVVISLNSNTVIEIPSELFSAAVYIILVGTFFTFFAQ